MRRRECRTHYISRVICFRQVTWLSAVRMWLAQGAKHLIFLRTEKNRGVFHEFYARFFIIACFILWSARAFGRNCTRVSLHSRPRPQHTIWIEHSDWSIFEFLVRDFLKTSCTEYIARLILSSPPYYYSWVHVQVSPWSLGAGEGVDILLFILWLTPFIINIFLRGLLHTYYM